jgi:hypothetical protein
VINTREIEIDHANWAWSGKGNISRGVRVIDVSERNDWTEVRVELGHSEDFGSIYATYGFIYDHPDRGTAEAAATRPTATAPERDIGGGYDEVAEAPADDPGSMAFDAPDRSVR